MIAEGPTIYSSPGSGVEAWFQNFGNGTQDYHSINHLSYVRAVRTF